MVTKNLILFAGIYCACTSSLLAIPKAGDKEKEKQKMEKILENENKVKKHFMSHKWLVVNTDGSKKKGKQEIVSFSRSKKILNEEGKQLPQGHFRFWGTLERQGSPTIYHLITKKKRKGGWYTFEYQAKKGYWKGASWGYRIQKEDK